MGKKDYTQRDLTEEENPRWREFVDSASSGSPYSYPEYLDALCRAAGGRFRILTVWKGDEIVGGVGLYELESRRLRLVRNRLLLYYNGLVVRDYSSKYPSKNTSSHLKIMAALQDSLQSRGYDSILLHSRHPLTDLRPFLVEGWNARPTYSYEVNLTDLESSFDRVDQNQRRLIRRAEEAGLDVEESDDFSSFFRMHAETAERKEAPLYLPEDRFRHFFSTLQNQKLLRLYQVRDERGESVASQLVLAGGHPVTHTIAAAADPEFLGLGTTPFLRWRVCEILGGEGFEANDLTDAALNEVTRFKSQLGGTLVRNSVLTDGGSRRYRIHRSRNRMVGRLRKMARRVLSRSSVEEG